MRILSSANRGDNIHSASSADKDSIDGVSVYIRYQHTSSSHSVNHVLNSEACVGSANGVGRYITEVPSLES